MAIHTMHSEWAGIGNFKYFFTSNSFSMLLRNTILLANWIVSKIDNENRII